MPRSNPESSLSYIDLEIDRTFHRRLRQAKERLLNLHRNTQDPMAQQTIKELAAPDLNHQPLGITYPELTVDFELKSGFIHLLPKFHGLTGEDPNKHLQAFHIVCATMRPQNITEEQIKLRAFPFSLEGGAKDWFFAIQPQSITSWMQLKKIFLEKYFPASRAAAIRKEISGIRQFNGESLHEYWERFKKLCAACPHHQLSDQLLIQNFYEGLNNMDRLMIDAASGGALVDKTPDEAKHLISNMAENSQQFGTRAGTVTKAVNEISAPHQSDIAKSLSEMTDILRQIQQAQVTNNIAKICGLCESPHHTTDMCPQIQGDATIAAFNTFPNKPTYTQSKPSYNSNTYNPNNRNHPNLSWTNNNTLNPLPQPQPTYQSANRYQPPHTRPPYQNQATQSPLEATLQKAMEMLEITNNRLAEQEKQIKDLHEKLNTTTQPVTQLPSQTVQNPKGCVQSLNSIVVEHIEEENEDEEWQLEEDLDPVKWTMHDDEHEDENMYPLDEEEEDPEEGEPEEDPEEDPEEVIEQGQEELSTVRNCCRLEEAPILPEKFKDPGPYVIDCQIGDILLRDCLCDPGAGANIIPWSIFTELGLKDLKPSKSEFIMANQSISKAEGILKDIKVSVEGMLFPADFYVIRTWGVEHNQVILGRPFLKTARFELDAFNGTYSISDNCHRMFYNVPPDKKDEVWERNSIFPYTPDGTEDEQSLTDKDSELSEDETTVQSSLPAYLPHNRFKPCRRSSGSKSNTVDNSNLIKVFPCYLPHEIYRKRKKRNREGTPPENLGDNNTAVRKLKHQGTIGSLKIFKKELHPS